jgi:hypothetical protein
MPMTKTLMTLSMPADAPPRARALAEQILLLTDHDLADPAERAAACLYTMCAWLAMCDDDVLCDEIIRGFNETINYLVCANRKLVTETKAKANDLKISVEEVAKKSGKEFLKPPTGH